MRSLARGIATIILGILAALVYFTAETVVDELGWVSFVRAYVQSGWRGAVLAEYGIALLAAAAFTAGVTATLWIDYGIRRWRKSRPKRYPIARIGWHSDEPANGGWGDYLHEWISFFSNSIRIGRARGFASN